MPVNISSVPNYNVASPDVVGNMAKMAQLKQMLGQNAMIPGQLQAQGLENQQRQQEIQSTQQKIQQQTYDQARQKAIDTAFQGAYTPDENGQPQLDEGKLVKGISQAGYGSAAPEIAGSLVKWHQAQTELQKTHQEVASKSVDMLGNLAYAAHQAGDDPHILISGLKQLAETDPSVAQIAQQLAANPEKAPELIKHLMGQSPEVQKLLTSRQEAEARSSSAKTSAERLQAELPGGALQPPDKAEMQDWLAKNEGKGPADYAKWKASLAPQINFNLQGGVFANPVPIKQGATGQDALSQMDPKVAAMVKMVGDYKQKSSEITQRMPTAAKANFLSALSAAYPNYDENEFPARNKMLTSFTSGAESKSINAINTAMGHVGVLNEAIDALNSGDVKVLNSLANKFGVQVGKTPVTTFNTIVHRVGPELAAAYIQGGGGEGERGTTAADFDPSLGAAQLKSNTAATVKLLRSKIGALEKQWNGTMKPGTPDQQFQSRFITPEAQSTLDRLAPQGSAGGGKGISVTDPRGVTHFFPDQQSADNFKKAAKIK